MIKAGMALQFIKTTGQRGFGIFRETMEEELVGRRDLEGLVRSALQKNLFSLQFQPIMSLPRGRICGFEALLRLTSEAGTPVSPELFIPVAEELGLLPETGEWVLNKACETAAGWPDGISAAVNLSPSQFATGSLPSQVQAALTASGLAPERLELEITEGILLKDTDAILQQLTELKALGVTIVMDDFGTGYSSLSYLWRFPFDKLKIDRSFMEAYSHSGETIQQILKAIVALGRALKMQVTIEGIETVFHARAVKDLAIDNLQGYLFGKPMADVEIPNAMLKDFVKTMNLPSDAAGPARTASSPEHKATIAG
ncbi:EAL domain-containing protein [Pannonibacter sp. Pt2-lr]